MFEAFGVVFERAAYVDFFERVIELQEPKIKMEEAYFKRGEIYYRQGNWEKAKFCYDKVEALNRSRHSPFARLSKDRLNAIRKAQLNEMP